jgi:hypothetical protein
MLYQQSQPSGAAQAFIDLLQKAASRGLIESIVGPELIAVLEGLSILGLRLQAMDLTALLPIDEFDPALVAMADVRAYFQGKSLLFRNPLVYLEYFVIQLRTSTLQMRYPNSSTTSSYVVSNLLSTSRSDRWF